MKHEVLLCKCYSSDHQIIFSYDDEDVFMEVHLCKLPFLKRLKRGIRYIFGYSSRYGHWDSVILSREHVEPLRNIIKAIEAVPDSVIDN